MSAVKIIRLVIATVVSLMSTPFVYGGGWALINFGAMGYYASKDPSGVQALEKLKVDIAARKGAVSPEFRENPIIKKSFRVAIWILSICIPMVMGILFGSIARSWLLALVPYGISLLMGANPLMVEGSLSSSEKIMAVILLQLPALLSFAWLFSRLTFKKGNAEMDLSP